MLAGCTNSYRAFPWQRDGLLIKIDADGVEVWHQLYGGDTGTGYLYSVEQTPDGGFILAGSTDPDGESPLEAWLVKTDENGDASDGHGWQRTFNLSSLDQLFSVQQADDGGFLAAGYTEYGDTPTSMWLVKTDPQGNAPDAP